MPCEVPTTSLRVLDEFLKFGDNRVISLSRNGKRITRAEQSEPFDLLTLTCANILIRSPGEKTWNIPASGTSSPNQLSNDERSNCTHKLGIDDCAPLHYFLHSKNPTARMSDIGQELSLTLKKTEDIANKTIHWQYQVGMGYRDQDGQWAHMTFVDGSLQSR